MDDNPSSNIPSQSMSWASHRHSDPHAAACRACDGPGKDAPVAGRPPPHQPLVGRALQKPWRQPAVLAILATRKYLRATPSITCSPTLRM